MTEIALLAVTKMQTGVCIGGTPLPSGDEPPRWVRPVKPFGTVLLDDIRYADGSLMRPWDLVALRLGRPRPRPPHFEDVEAEFVRPRPCLRRRLSEPESRAILDRMVEPDPQEVFVAKRRSLTVFQPERWNAAFAWDAYSGHYSARLWWPGCGRSDGLPVTDLKWRALGRRLTAAGPGVQHLEDTDLRRLLGFEAVYLVVGLSRAFYGDHWALVAAVHLFPDYEAAVDEQNL